MDFFEHQAISRRKTALLILYFVVAVISMIAMLYGIAILLFSFTGSKEATQQMSVWQPQIFFPVVIGTLLVIGLGSLFKTFELRGGGSRLAEELGGRQLHPNTTNPTERRVLNVVEEMALAAGTHVPPVFLLDKEPGINAFAAGFTPGDAVIGINRGTVENLSRDELQGVIAHEFSHILNGDMRMNLRLIGALHGILLVALIGMYVVRFTALTGGGGRRSDGKGGGAPILLFGLAMVVIGYVGLFFARLIKAAISRQREYLADASAVQFTRNPDGIGGALKKIGALSVGSRMKAPAAESASHMFFGNFRGGHIAWLATHPPLDDRIRQIDPQFDGNFARVAEELQRRQPAPAPEAAASRSPLEGVRRPLGAAGRALPIDPLLITAMAGSPTTAHVDHARGLLDQLPDSLRQAVREPFSARALVAALLLVEDEAIRSQQLEVITAKIGQPATDESLRLAAPIGTLDPQLRLPLVELVKSTLQQLSPEQYRSFREMVIELVKADNNWSLFEFAMQRLLIRRLDQHFAGRKPPRVRYPAIGGLQNELSDLMSALAYVGAQSQQDADAAFQQAVAAIGPDYAFVLRRREECSLAKIDAALNKLAESSPPIKKKVLNAAAAAVFADGVVTLAEGELLRVVGDSIDCPLPPLLPGAAKH